MRLPLSLTRTSCPATALAMVVAGERSSPAGSTSTTCTVGGWGGALLVGDLAGDRWRTRGYPVRTGAVPGDPGWFPTSDFLDRI